MPVHQDPYQRETVKHYIRHFAFLSEKILKLNGHPQTEWLLSTLESTTLNETIRSASKWFILTKKRKTQSWLISSV